MKLNKYFMLSILLLIILAIGAASASEDLSDEASAVEPIDDITIEESSEDEIISDSIDEEILDDSQTEKIEESDEDVLTGEELSFTDLKAELTSDKTEIILENNYKYNSGDPTVINTSSNKPFVLDGKGHTIDGDGADLNLTINSNNVVFKNLIFKNFSKTYFDSHSGFIVWKASGGSLINCTFKNMDSQSDLIYVFSGYSDFTVDQCTFENNHITGNSLIEGSNCLVNNTNFYNNTGDDSYDALCRLSNTGRVNNCSFIDNSFTQFLLTTSFLNNTRFINNIISAYSSMYLVNVLGDGSQMTGCTFEGNSVYNPQTDIKPIVNVGIKGSSGNYLSANVIVCNNNFTNNLGLPINWTAQSGSISDCNFISNLGSIQLENSDGVEVQFGDYDVEVVVNNNTTAGVPSQISVDYMTGEGPVNYNRTLVTVNNLGNIGLDDISIYLNDVKCYSGFIDSDSETIDIDSLSDFRYGFVDLVIKSKIGGLDRVIYNRTVLINFFMDFTYMDFDYFNNCEVMRYLHSSISKPILFSLSSHETKAFNITLPEGVTGTLTVDDGVKNHTLDGNSFTLNVCNHSIGTHQLSLSLTDDPNFPNKTIKYTFEVKFYPKVPNRVFTEEDEYMEFDLPDNYDGNLTIYKMNGNAIGPVIKSIPAKGLVVIPLDFLELGENDILVNITGMYPYRETITYLENDPSISSSLASSSIEIGSDAVLKITVPSSDYEIYGCVDDDEWKEFYLSGNTSYAYHISGLSLGKHKIEFNIEGSDGNYIYGKTLYVTVKEKGQVTPSPSSNPSTKPSSSSSSATKVPAKIVAKDYSAYYNKGIYAVTVYGTDGKVAKGVKVVFKIDGKKIGTAITNSKGVAKIKISKVPKSYKISSTALGKSVTKKLVVKQVLKLKKVKVKRSAKKLVITATLKEGKKALKGKKIIFKFKGKKYVAKTNKKGIAKITIKKSVLKKLKAGKKITYQATYIKDTVKRTVKVKK